MSAQQDGPDDTSHGSQAPPRGVSSYRVLIVDDQPEVLRSMRRVLGQHEVITAQGGVEALQLIESGERFDVLFCDVVMPEVTGLDVLERLQALAPDQATRLVFFTGGIPNDATRNRIVAHRNPLFMKPLDSARLLEIVAAVANGLPVE